MRRREHQSRTKDGADDGQEYATRARDAATSDEQSVGDRDRNDQHHRDDMTDSIRMTPERRGVHHGDGAQINY
jgi:hypothetical protein